MLEKLHNPLCSIIIQFSFCGGQPTLFEGEREAKKEKEAKMKKKGKNGARRNQGIKNTSKKKSKIEKRQNP